MSDDAPIIWVVDDDPAVRDSVGFLVASLGYAYETCTSAREFLERLDDARPCCVVLDVRLPGLSGLELQGELLRRGSTVGIVFVSGHGDIPKAVRAVRLGAFDFLEKPFDDQILLDRVGEALEASREAIAERRRRGLLERRLAALTEREREVLARVVAGKTSKAIALELDISAKTVENHRANLMAKAGVNSVAQLIAWASDPTDI
ncbi:MAG: response regulator [Hyphomicrobiales bacterium]|nr:response regulator [Hyphomicrobiales bacterium]